MFEPLSPGDYFWTQVNFVKSIWPLYVVVVLIGIGAWIKSKLE